MLKLKVTWIDQKMFRIFVKVFVDIVFSKATSQGF